MTISKINGTIAKCRSVQLSRNNDSVYQTAIELHEAGSKVTIIDSRKKINIELPSNSSTLKTLERAEEIRRQVIDSNLIALDIVFSRKQFFP